MKKSIKVTTDIIEKLNPCESSFNNFKERYPNYSGTLLEALDLKGITEQDKIWVALRLLPRHIVEVFAIDCAFSAYSTASKAAADYNAAVIAYVYSTSAADAAADATAYTAYTAATVAVAAYAAAKHAVTAYEAATYYATTYYATTYSDTNASYGPDFASYAGISERKKQIEVLKYLIKTGVYKS